MTIRRVVPNLSTSKLRESVQFYTELFQFEVAMDLDWIVTLASPSERVAQLSLVRQDEPEPAESPRAGVSISIEVVEVDTIHERARAMGLSLELPLTDEEWGVRRFQLRDPNGVLLNVLSHAEGD